MVIWIKRLGILIGVTVGVFVFMCLGVLLDLMVISKVGP